MPTPQDAEPIPDRTGSVPVGRQRNPVRSDHRRYELVLAAAGDLIHADTAYQAELLVSTLLGSVYALADGDRGQVVDQFTDGMARYLDGRSVNRPERDEPTTVTAATLQSVLNALLPPPTAETPQPAETARHAETPRHAGVADPGGALPAWARQLAAVSNTGAWAYCDEYEDQVTYVATFEYTDPALGGPEHALGALIDRNLGVVKDLFLAAPGSAVVEHLRAGTSEDGSARLIAVAPATLRAEVCRYLTVTDRAPQLPADTSFETDRALAMARLRGLPAAPDPLDENAVVADPVSQFRDSIESGRLVGAPGDAASLEFCLDLILRFASGRPDQDPLRWSPTAVRLFLLDWVPAQAILDATDRALLPRVLDAWIRWAGRRRRRSPGSVARTVASIARFRPQFVRRSRNGTHQSAEAKAVRRMLADGVDFDDDAAVARWIATYNAEEDRDEVSTEDPPSHH